MTALQVFAIASAATATDHNRKTCRSVTRPLIEYTKYIHQTENLWEDRKDYRENIIHVDKRKTRTSKQIYRAENPCLNQRHCKQRKSSVSSTITVSMGMHLFDLEKATAEGCRKPND